jgi:fructokinase
MSCDVMCFGELFIDLVPNGSVDGKLLFAACPGGAPGNVAVGLASLGHKAFMLSRVGDDAFGRLLVATLDSHGVDVSGVRLSPMERTGHSVVTLDKEGDRSFTFYHDNPADLNIDPQDVSPDAVTGARMLHVGVLPLSAPKSAAAQRKAMDLADAAGLSISCDLNFRPAMWQDAEEMVEAGRFVISRSAIVKVSEEELAALSGSDKMDDAVQSLWHEKLRLFSVTRGAHGAVLYGERGTAVFQGFAVNAIDTTGAGDAYTAALLSGVLDGAADDQLPQLLLQACAAGALATTKTGAMDSLPSRNNIAQLLGQQQVSVTYRPRN